MADAHQTLLDRIGEALGMRAEAFYRFGNTQETMAEQTETLLALFASIADPKRRMLVIDFARRIAMSDGRPDSLPEA